MASKKEALVALYDTINGPVAAGRKYVKYTRGQAEAMLDVLKQLMVHEGFEFREENHAG